MKFRKKPIIIEAYRVVDLLRFFEKSWKDLPKVVADAYETGIFVPCSNILYIETLEGNMEAKKEDWLICGVKGEFYPCKPDIFEATYEKVEES